MNNILSEEGLRKTLNNLESAGVIRQKPWTGRRIVVARPEHHEIKAQIKIDPLSGKWFDLRSKTNGSGYLGMCRRLGIDLGIATAAQFLESP